MFLVEHTEDSLQRLLDQELECFHSILDETKTFFKQLDSFSLESIVELLNSRQKWIDIIKKLEEKRKEVKAIDYELDLTYLEQNITEIAQTLIVIDAKILDILQTIKSKNVNEIANVANKHERNKRMQSMRTGKMRIVDVLQE